MSHACRKLPRLPISLDVIYFRCFPKSRKSSGQQLQSKRWWHLRVPPCFQTLDSKTRLRITTAMRSLPTFSHSTTSFLMSRPHTSPGRLQTDGPKSQLQVLQSTASTKHPKPLNSCVTYHTSPTNSPGSWSPQWCATTDVWQYRQQHTVSTRTGCTT